MVLLFLNTTPFSPRLFIRKVSLHVSWFSTHFPEQPDLLPPRKELSGTHACSFSSQLGHSQPQRPTVGRYAFSELSASLHNAVPGEVEIFGGLNPCTAPFRLAVHSNSCICNFSRSIQRKRPNKIKKLCSFSLKTFLYRIFISNGLRMVSEPY